MTTGWRVHTDPPTQTPSYMKFKAYIIQWVRCLTHSRCPIHASSLPLAQLYLPPDPFEHKTVQKKWEGVRVDTLLLISQIWSVCGASCWVSTPAYQWGCVWSRIVCAHKPWPSLSMEASSSGSPCRNLSHPNCADGRSNRTMPFVSAVLTNPFHSAVQSTLFPYSFWLGWAFLFSIKN